MGVLTLRSSSDRHLPAPLPARPRGVWWLRIERGHGASGRARRCASAMAGWGWVPPGEERERCGESIDAAHGNVDARVARVERRRRHERRAHRRVRVEGLGPGELPAVAWAVGARVRVVVGVAEKNVFLLSLLIFFYVFLIFSSLIIMYVHCMFFV